MRLVTEMSSLTRSLGRNMFFYDFFFEYSGIPCANATDYFSKAIKTERKKEKLFFLLDSFTIRGLDRYKSSI